MSPFGTTTTHKLLPYIHTLQQRLVCFTSQASGLLRRPAWLSQSYARPIAHFGTLTLPCLCLESRSYIQDIHIQGRLSGRPSALRSTTRKRAPPSCLPLSVFTPAAAIHAHIAMVTAAAVDSVIGLEASRGGFGGINQHRLGGGGGASETLISLTPPVL